MGGWADGQIEIIQKMWKSSNYLLFFAFFYLPIRPSALGCLTPTPAFPSLCVH